MNLRVYCQAHNQLAAEQAFGREHVERRKHLRQRKFRGANVMEKVELALTTLGFRAAQARRAVERVAAARLEPLAAEEALRAALRIAGEK